MIKNNFGVTRIGVTASKKIGNAVVRNRARRVIKAAWCGLAPRILSGLDILFIARNSTAGSKMKIVQREIFFVAKKFSISKLKI
jgi:ribonuclease P protein component